MSVSAYVAILHEPNQKLFYSKTLNLDEADVILIWGGQVFANVHHTTDTYAKQSLWKMPLHLFYLFNVTY